MNRNLQLTEAQEETLSAIKRYIYEHGKSPTMGELQKLFGLHSIRSVTQRIEALERKGFIERDRFQHRSIKVLKNTVAYVGSGFIAVPVIASAGCDAMEVYAQDEFGEFIAVDKNLIGKATAIVAIRAIGDSMQDAGIKDGDHVIVEVTEQVGEGDKVVAVVGNMAVIKQFRKKNGIVILEPKNTLGDYKPIEVREEDSKIFGKVLSVIPNQDWEDDIKIEYYDGFGPKLP